MSSAEEPADPRVDALAERLYGLGFGPRDARRNVASAYLRAANTADPYRLLLTPDNPAAVDVVMDALTNHGWLLIHDPQGSAQAVLAALRSYLDGAQ